MTRPTPIDRGYRVVDLSEGIAGAYASKVLADAGAEVVLVEPPGGSRLRRWSASRASIDAAVGGVLFQYLGCSKRSVVADLDDPVDRAMVLDLLRGADAVIWSEESSLCRKGLGVDEIRSVAPGANVLALSGFGLTNAWVGRPSNEFIWESLAGSAWNHGSPDGTPLMLGGNLGDFAHGTVGALALLIAKVRAAATGTGELLDVAGVEVLGLTHTMFPVTFLDLAKRPYRTVRTDSIPSIHPTRDGWIGLWVTTGQQWQDFCTMVERPDWLEDPSLGLMDNRALRHEELVGAIEAWTTQRTTDEIVELASLFRLPVAPIGNGETLPGFDHMVERQAYVLNPRSGCPQPDVWYRSTGHGPRAFEPSPTLGADTEQIRAQPVAPRRKPLADVGDDSVSPFERLRIVDMTAFWAGPIIAHPLAMLGAEVIHVESARRPDGIRMAATVPFNQPGWFETSPFFNGTNTCKRGLTLDLQTDTGRDLLKRLVAASDVVIENYSPRVMGQLGLTYEDLRAVKPDIIMVRAPAFGTDGPWRDRVGYAPTIDQAGGLAWMTGLPGEAPKLIGAASDALGGLHGTMALLLALEHRARTGEGALIDAAQIGTALQFSAEQVAEQAVNGVLLTRSGNRSVMRAPQGVYRSADRAGTHPNVPDDDWLAVSVDDDDQWRAMCGVIGLSGTDLGLDLDARLAAHDRIDEAIASWARALDAESAANVLASAGVPACRVLPPHEMPASEPFSGAGYFETVVHPVAGPMRVPRFPIRSSKGPEVWNSRPAPCLGEHNIEVLCGLLGLTSAEVDQLVADGVIGTATTVNLGW